MQIYRLFKKWLTVKISKSKHKVSGAKEKRKRSEGAQHQLDRSTEVFMSSSGITSVQAPTRNSRMLYVPIIFVSLTSLTHSIEKSERILLGGEHLRSQIS